MDPVSTTARWTAAVRAVESDREDRLFHDPLAGVLAGEEGFRLLGDAGVSDVGVYVAIRTRFFDDFIMQVAGDGVRQVVLVAAGMDARAFRLAWPEGTSLYELDRPELLRVKDEILARQSAEARCRRVAVGVDLTGDWTDALLAAGFRPDERSLWIAEGVFFYLVQSEVDHLLARLSALASTGSRLGADFINESFLTSPWMALALAEMERRGMPWLSATDHPETLLGACGWSAEVTRPGEEGAGAGRWPYPVPPRGIPGIPESFLVRAAKSILTSISDSD
jgi:methyltransferase (TIGR00027 family)